MLKPSKLSLEQAKKVFRAMVYVALSSAITTAITYATDNQEMFGVFYPIVNLLLVFLKQVFTKQEIEE